MAGGDIQFCLRWNSHLTTLTSIFTELRDEGKLFDCSIAAEGRSLKAHRILLSACSPYFNHLISQHSEGFPIFILQDVKFKELQALMDYMYRGEVTISQYDLANLLLVAENLKIRGLSETTARTDNRPPPGRQPLAMPAPPPVVPRNGPTVEQRRTNDLHTDHPSTSAEAPGPRKRKRVRRRSSDDESGSGMSQIPIELLNSSYNNASSPIVQSLPRLQVNSTASSKITAVIPKTVLDRPLIPEPTPHPVIVPKTKPPIEQVLVRELEVDNTADDSDDYEEISWDDDMLDDSQPGPSHGSEGSNSQGFSPRQMGDDGSMDHDLMQEQDAAGGSRDADDINDTQPPAIVIDLMDDDNMDIEVIDSDESEEEQAPVQVKKRRGPAPRARSAEDSSPDEQTENIVNGQPLVKSYVCHRCLRRVVNLKRHFIRVHNLPEARAHKKTKRHRMRRTAGLRQPTPEGHRTDSSTEGEDDLGAQERKYICETCGSRVHNLRRHLRQCHKEMGKELIKSKRTRWAIRRQLGNTRFPKTACDDTSVPE